MKQRIVTILVFLCIVGIAVCTSCTPEPEPTPTLTVTSSPVPPTATPTVTFTPTLTYTPTLEPTATATATPTPTPDPLTEILTDMDVLASYYGEDVEIVVTDENRLLPYYVPQFSVAIPPKMYFTSEMDLTETGSTRIDGTFFDSNRILTIGTQPWEEDMLPEPEDMLGIMITQLTVTVYSDGEFIREEHEILDIGTKGAVFLTMIFEYPDHYLLVQELSITEEYSSNLDVYVLYDLSDEYETIEAAEEAIVQNKEELLALHESFTLHDEYLEIAHNVLPLEIYSGICPTSTDPSYGFTKENPIRMVDDLGEQLDASMLGPWLADNYFHTLLFDGHPIYFNRTGSINYGDTILDEYKITGPTIITPMYLYVDQYSSSPYKLPVGFSCNGILYPVHYLEDNGWVDESLDTIFQWIFNN